MSGTFQGRAEWFALDSGRGADHVHVTDLSPPWFSMLTTAESWPWIFENAEGPALIYSSLEALAVFICSEASPG